MSSDIKNTSDLREMLIETIREVKSGSIDTKQARTIAALSTTILHSAKLDLDVMRFQAKLEDNKGIPTPLALVDSKQ